MKKKTRLLCRQTVLLLVLLLLPLLVAAQLTLSEQQAVELALRNHPAIESATYSVRQQELLKNSGASWEPAQIFHNVAADPEVGMFGTTALGIQQNFPSRKLTRANRQLYDNLQVQATARLAITRHDVVRQVREIYHHLSYLDGKAALIERLDSMFRRVASAVELRYQAGEVSLAEKLALQDKARQVQLEARTVQHEIEFDRLVLGQLLGLNEPVSPVVEPLHEGSFSIADTLQLRTSAWVRHAGSAIEVARSEQAVVAAQFAPTASVGVFGQYLGNGDFYPGWQLGLNVPLFRKSLQVRSEAAQTGIAVAEAEYRKTLLQRQNDLAHLLHEQEKYLILLEYYAREGKALAAELLRNGELNYLQGELGFFGFVQLLEQAAGIELQHLEHLIGLNQVIIELEALTAQ